MQDSGFIFSDSGFKICKNRIQDSSGFRIQDSGCRMQDAGCRIKAIHCVEQNGALGIRIWTKKLRIQSKRLRI